MNNNVVLITIDALRSDFVGHLVEGTGERSGRSSSVEGCTPTIDTIAADGMSCTNAYANGIPTYFAFRSILGGRRDVIDDEPIGLPDGSTTVADVFSSHGYDTAAFNAANPWLTPEFNYDSGFDTFVDFIETESDDGIGSTLVDLMQNAQKRIPDGVLRDKLGLAARTFCSVTGNYPIESADTVTTSALEWLSGRSDEDPYFLWVHYMDPHYPWTPPSDDTSSWEVARTWHKVAHMYNDSDQRPTKSTIDDVRRLYSREVSNVDSAIGRLLDELEQRGDRDDTVLCITGDHGTELGDHGGFSHGPGSLYDEVVHVPLVLSGPDVPRTTISDPVQHVDIPSTLVDASGIDTPASKAERGWSGEPLDQCRRDAALVQVVYDYDPAVSLKADTGLLNAVVDYPWKLHWNEHTGAVELYDLDEDPCESDDLSDTRPETVERLKRTVRSKQVSIETDFRTAVETAAVRRQARRIKHP